MSKPRPSKAPTIEHDFLGMTIQTPGNRIDIHVCRGLLCNSRQGILHGGLLKTPLQNKPRRRCPYRAFQIMIDIDQIHKPRVPESVNHPLRRPSHFRRYKVGLTHHPRRYTRKTPTKRVKEFHDFPNDQITCTVQPLFVPHSPTTVNCQIHHLERSTELDFVETDPAFAEEPGSLNGGRTKFTIQVLLLFPPLGVANNLRCGCGQYCGLERGICPHAHPCEGPCRGKHWGSFRVREGEARRAAQVQWGSVSGLGLGL